MIMKRFSCSLSKSARRSRGRDGVQERLHVPTPVLLQDDRSSDLQNGAHVFTRLRSCHDVREFARPHHTQSKTFVSSVETQFSHDKETPDREAKASD